MKTSDVNISAGLLDLLLEEHRRVGLPARFGQARDVETGGNRWETVIENDIAWRVAVLVDFMFGRPVTIQSAARLGPWQRNVPFTNTR